MDLRNPAAMHGLLGAVQWLHQYPDITAGSGRQSLLKAHQTCAAVAFPTSRPFPSFLSAFLWSARQPPAHFPNMPEGPWHLPRGIR